PGLRERQTTSHIIFSRHIFLQLVPKYITYPFLPYNGCKVAHEGPLPAVLFRSVFRSQYKIRRSLFLSVSTHLRDSSKISLPATRTKMFSPSPLHPYPVPCAL